MHQMKAETTIHMFLTKTIQLLIENVSFLWHEKSSRFDSKKIVKIEFFMFAKSQFEYLIFYQNESK